MAKKTSPTRSTKKTRVTKKKMLAALTRLVLVKQTGQSIITSTFRKLALVVPNLQYQNRRGRGQRFILI